jgi:hypothetical protein
LTWSCAAPDREEREGWIDFMVDLARFEGAQLAAAHHQGAIADSGKLLDFGRDDEHPRAGLPVTWAALDCVGGWAGDLEERLMVLARITARLDSLPVIGEEHVLVGLGRGREGRKAWTSSTMYDADGRVVGSAEHLWIAVDPAAFS